jgi:hypothetical protein
MRLKRVKFVDLCRGTISPRFADILLSSHNKPIISDATQKSMNVYADGHIFGAGVELGIDEIAPVKALSTKSLSTVLT